MALINYLTTVQFDFGALALLGGELRRLGIARPLLVTDRGVVAAGLLERARACMPDALAGGVYDGTPANPTEAAVHEALARFREGRCDGIVAIGGGSPIDLAKAVALLAAHPGPLVRYAAVEGGTAHITAQVAPLVAIPTTAGTGSEVGRATLIVMNDGRKLAMLSPHLLPRLALCDPALTLGLPPSITAGTGMDAIAHCIETFLSPAVNPPADAIALDGLRRAGAHLERAVRDGGDRDARWNMMMASIEGGLAFQKGLGAVHALSHALGSLAAPRLHHGTLNAVLLPAVLRFNAAHVGDKPSRIAGALGLAPDADVAAFIAGLNARLGLPRGLAQMGVGREVLARMAELAMQDHSNASNPRTVTAVDCAYLLEQSFA
jgi:hypothetical protein